MKKIICLVMALLMVLVTVGCTTSSNSETTGSSGIVEPAISEETNEQTSGSTDETTGDEIEGNVLQVPTKDIYFTYPENWFDAEGTKTTMVMESDECMVAVCYDWHNDFDGDLKGLISFFSPRFIDDAYSYCKGNISASEITVTSSKEAKVAGYDSVNFTGTVSNKGEWDCHVYGYTFVVDGVRLMVIGLVSTKAQDANMISEIDALTDQIASSVRTEK